MADKEHVKKIKDSKFNRQRAETSVLRSNCSTGYIFTSDGMAKKQSEFHHILSISSLQDASIKPADKLGFFHDCMAVTDWDTNNGPNLIGLPLKKVYENADRYEAEPLVSLVESQLHGVANADAQLGVFGSLPNLPCHQVEHDEYNTQLILDLIKNIWRPLARNQKNCSVDGQSIQGELEGSSVAWRSFLVGRGAACGGAAQCWRNRNKPGYASIWYIPFSMNPGTPKKVLPPPSLGERSGKIRAWLKTLFSTIV